MSFQDKTLQCFDCGQEFTFGVEEQELFHSKGHHNDPKRCQDCRQARKADRPAVTSNFGSQRQMFPAVCAECNKATEVPFQPRSDRPVYCSDCYRAKSPRRY